MNYTLRITADTEALDHVTRNDIAGIVNATLRRLAHHATQRRVTAMVDGPGETFWALTVDLTGMTADEVHADLEAEGQTLAGHLHWRADHAGTWHQSDVDQSTSNSGT